MNILKFRAWNKVDNCWVKDICAKYCFRGKTATIESKDLIFEPFTGAYDKNATPIYEGDVVKYHDEILYVSYFGSSFIMAYPNCANVWVNCIPGDNSVEIIGNVHEHAELLNVQAD